MYLRAIEHDSNNYGAWLNLGFLDIEEEELERALRRLERARSLSGETEPPDLVWYVATYQIAAVNHYRGELVLAKDFAKEVVDCIKEELEVEEPSLPRPLLQIMNWLRRDVFKTGTETRRRKFYRTFQNGATILFAGILAAGEDPIEAKRLVEAIDSATLTYLDRYDLACFYSTLAESSTHLRDHALESSLEHLGIALRHDPTLGKWAKRDPSLEYVRVEKQNDFEEVAEKYSDISPTSAAAESDLAPLNLIGPTNAAILSELRILTPDELILAAGAPDDRETLAKELGLSEPRLLSWARLADMMRIVGLGKHEANLLEAANVSSLDELSKADPRALTKALYERNRELSYFERGPSLETVLRWTVEASETKSAIW